MQSPSPDLGSPLESSVTESERMSAFPPTRATESPVLLSEDVEGRAIQREKMLDQYLVSSPVQQLAHHGQPLPRRSLAQKTITRPTQPGQSDRTSDSDGAGSFLRAQSRDHKGTKRILLMLSFFLFAAAIGVALLFEEEEPDLNELSINVDQAIAICATVPLQENGNPVDEDNAVCLNTTHYVRCKDGELNEVLDDDEDPDTLQEDFSRTCPEANEGQLCLCGVGLLVEDSRPCDGDDSNDSDNCDVLVESFLRSRLLK